MPSDFDFSSTKPTHGFNLHITLAMAVAGLLSIVDRFGEDHINEGACVYAGETYTHILTPVCIVGQFFADLGILRALLMPDDSQSASVVCDGLFNMGAMAGPDFLRILRESHTITFDDEAFEFLRTAQGEQDQHIAWGEAVQTAAQRVLDNMGQPHQTPAQRLLDLAG